MPNRILREGILDSERVNALDWEEEVFFRRLLSVVDDYGRCEAHNAKLRASLYPLKLDQVREANVERLLTKISSEPIRLVRLYTVGGKRYLEVHNFRQQTRSDSKYPPPPAAQTPSTCVADAKHPPSTSSADAQQPISNAHLGVGVFGDVFVDEGVSGARTRAGESSGSSKRKTKLGSVLPSEQPPELGQRMIAVGALMRRREDTAWAAEELAAFNAARLHACSEADFADQVETMRGYYHAKIPCEKDFRRRDLKTLLNNWPGELDRARAHNRDHNDGIRKV